MSAPDPFLLATALQWLAEGRGVAIATVHSDLGLGAAARGQPAPDRCRRQFSGLGVGRLCRGGGRRRSGRRDRHRRSRRTLEFGVEDDTAWKVGLACGGAIRIFVEPLAADSPDGVLPRLVARCRSAPRGGAGHAILPPARGASLIRQAIWDRTWRRRCTRRFAATKAWRSQGRTASCSSTCSIRRCGSSSSAPCMWRSSLVPMARALGYEVVVVDPRSAFATEERFGDTRDRSRMARRGAA